MRSALSSVYNSPTPCIPTNSALPFNAHVVGVQIFLLTNLHQASASCKRLLPEGKVDTAFLLGFTHLAGTQKDDPLTY